MLKKKYFSIFVYLGVLWLIGIFIFGKSGILENMYQSKEILRLTELVWKSGIEIEEMTREYYRLKDMKTPNQAFLIEQGRKSQDVVVFKIKDQDLVPQNTRILLEAEKKIFFHSSLIVCIMLITGCLALFAISYLGRKHSIFVEEELE